MSLNLPLKELAMDGYLIMNKMKKIIMVAVILSTVTVPTSCSRDSEDKPLLSESSPLLDVSTELPEYAGWETDESGMFTYKEYVPVNGCEIYFEPKVGCPDNMVLYKSNVDDKEMYGYMDTNFHVLSEPINELPMIFQYGYAVLVQDHRSKVMDRDFSIVDESGFSTIIKGDSVLFVNWHFYPVEEPRIITGIDRDKYLVPYTITHNKETGEALPIPITGFKTVNDAYDGDIAPEDNFAFPPDYIVVDGFFDGLAPIIYNNNFAFINEKGELVIDKDYNSLYRNFENGVAVVSTHDREINGELVNGLCVIDREGNELTDLYNIIGNFKDGYAASSGKNRKWTYLNTRGERINEVDYFKTNTFSNGMGRVKLLEGYSFIDTDGNRIGAPIFEGALDFSDGTAAVKSNGYWGYIGKDGLYRIEPKYLSASSFSNGFALVKDSLGAPGFVIDEMENRYLEELGITRLTRFNDDGYAIALTQKLVNDTMISSYYMIHLENYDRE